MRVDATIADEHAWCADALAAGVTRPQWRVWQYREPEIVLGCSQRGLRDAVTRRAPPGVAVSVRASGGGAVLAGPWLLGVSVVLPPGHRLLGEDLVDSYRWLGELHASQLREAGIDARALDPRQARASIHDDRAAVRWACFGGLSAWEVVDAEGRKLTGLAQQRRRTGVAFSAGTLVARSDWALLCDAVGEPADAARLAARTVACADVRGAARVSAEGWAERIAATLDAVFDEALD